MSDFYRFVADRANALAEKVVAAWDAIDDAFREFDAVRGDLGDADDKKEER